MHITTGVVMVSLPAAVDGTLGLPISWKVVCSRRKLSHSLKRANHETLDHTFVDMKGTNCFYKPRNVAKQIRFRLQSFSPCFQPWWSGDQSDCWLWKCAANVSNTRRSISTRWFAKQLNSKETCSKSTHVCPHRKQTLRFGGNGQRLHFRK